MESDAIAGRYTVVRAVGKGGMGTVWLCTDETLHRQVAVKQIGSLPGESPGDTARAMREARLAAALNHENAVSIYDVVEHDGSTWLVMEYVPSQTLSQVLAADGRLSPERVARIGTQVAAALSSAHDLGIVHRDIKPGNILVGDDDAAKISDFGIARGHQDSQLTQTGMVSGTPGFFSPELARGEDPTFASDVWAFGITLYAAVEGSPPYKPQANPLAMLSAITRDPLTPPAHAGPLTGVLAGMLDPDVTQRSSMSEALTALREIEQSGKTSVTSRQAAGAAAAAPVAADQTNVIEDAVEPAYERSVTTPVVASSWADESAGAQPEPEQQRSSFGRLVMAALAILVLVGAGALLWNTLGIGADDETDPGSTNTPNVAGNKSSGSSPQTDPTASTAESEPTGQSTSKPPKTNEPSTPEPSTPEPSTPEPSTPEPSTPEPSTPEPAPSSSPEEFTQSYFGTVPDDLDTGWSLLAPSYQAELGRGTYDGFWNTIDSVDIVSVDSVDEGTVNYQIIYTRNDGSTSEESKQLTLEPNGDSYLITSDT